MSFALSSGKVYLSLIAVPANASFVYHYAYTYTFPEADTYTITYRWVGTEVPEGVRLPAQQTEQESSAGKNPTFEIATVTSADKKWSFSGAVRNGIAY